MNQDTEISTALLPLEVVDLVRKKPEVATYLMLQMAKALNQHLSIEMNLDQLSLVLFNYIDNTDTTGKIEIEDSFSPLPKEEIN